MIERILKKIEYIRSQPEHIRLRYAMGAVIISMIFVIGIWTLTLKQGFLGVTKEIDSNKDKVQDSISNVKEAFPSGASLKTLKDNSQPLRVDGAHDDAEMFINSEIEKSTSNKTTP